MELGIRVALLDMYMAFGEMGMISTSLGRRQQLL